MTNHHDEMRVAPDPARAEELRQRLHARLAAVDQGLPRSTPSAGTDPDEREGDLIMLETEDRPAGHEPPTPGRRSPGSWLLVAAVVAIVAVAGALLVAAADDDETQVPAGPPTTVPAKDMLDLLGVTELEPGSYYIDPDGDDTTPLRVTYDIAAEGWGGWFGGLKNTDPEGGQSGFSITTVTNLVTDGCTNARPLDPAVGPTVDDLATALTQLAPFEVAAAPTAVTLAGYSGKHLELTVPADMRVTGGTDDTRRFADCTNGELRSWISPLVGGSFWGYNGLAGTSEEFWILDVEGTRLVLVQLTSPDTPAQDIAERDAIFDSISIQP